METDRKEWGEIKRDTDRHVTRTPRKATTTEQHHTWLIMTIADNLSDKFDFEELAPAKSKAKYLQSNQVILL